MLRRPCKYDPLINNSLASLLLSETGKCTSAQLAARLLSAAQQVQKENIFTLNSAMTVMTLFILKRSQPDSLAALLDISSLRVAM